MIAAYVGFMAVALGFAFVLFVFGFWIGRCGRRLPIIDEHLPWTMSRGQAPRCPPDCNARDYIANSPPVWPQG
jgi:hypothetical protein